MYPHVIRLRGPWTVRAGGATATMNVPGQWKNFGLADHRGPATLERRFHWTARLEPDEAAVLRIDRAVGRGPIRLNGVQIARLESPWLECRVDVTALLQRSNLLELELDASDADERWGTLGDDGLPIGGVLGGATLSIESRSLMLESTAIDGTHRGGEGRVRIEAELMSPAESIDDRRFVPRLAVSVGGELLHESDWTCAGEGIFELALHDLAAAPWRPRIFGPTQRIELQFEGRAGGIPCFDQLIEIGLVDVDSAQAKVARRTMSASTANLPFAGEDPGKPFDSWSIAESPCVVMAGHVPPDSLLKLFDRSGTLVEIEAPALPEGLAFQRGSDTATGGMRGAERTASISSPVEWRRLLGRLISHPCVRSVRRWGG